MSIPVIGRAMWVARLPLPAVEGGGGHAILLVSSEVDDEFLLQISGFSLSER